MSDDVVVPLLIHGRVLWTPAARPLVPQPGRFPLVGRVHWQELFMAAHPDHAAQEARCPVVASAVWRATW
jgi:hypothetical protein